MWLQIARTAHEIGLHSNATMLFGHVETLEERVDHLVRLRESQDKTHGFVAFIPLEFHPDNTALSHLPKPTGIDDLKTIAVSRLLLDNFDHIKAYWIMLTPRIAQIALRFGANDLDGTVVEEKIYHDAGATTPERLSRVELERLIRAAGCVPSSATRSTTGSTARKCRRSRLLRVLAVLTGLFPKPRSPSTSDGGISPSLGLISITQHRPERSLNPSSRFGRGLGRLCIGTLIGMVHTREPV